MRILPAILVAALLVSAACEPAPGEPAAVTEARRAATRDICIAREILQHAQEGHAALQEFQQEASLMAGISRAALEFAAAAENHAHLRYTAIAYTDSAMNHARTPADSARYMERSDAFEVRRPQPGTIEENIAAAWVRDYAAFLADEDHRCNWDF